MKKINWKYILILFGGVLALSAIASLILGIVNGNLAGFTGIMFVFVFILSIMMFVFHTQSNFVTDRLMKKTLETDEKAASSQNCSTFTTNDGILKIDEANGRIGFVYYLNPTEFVVISAKNITDIKSDYMKGPLGGTNFVYFQFVYEGKRTRIATFTSRNMYSVKSAEVMEAMSKADAYAELLERTKNVAQ